MVSCVHHIPGRVRFKIEALRRDDQLANLIEKKVGSLDGVKSIEINRYAASIIVHYCTEVGEIDCIMDHICEHCPKASLNRRVERHARSSANKDGSGTDSMAVAKIDRQAEPASRQAGNAAKSQDNPSVTSIMGQAVSKAVLNTFINHTINRGFSSILTRNR